MAQKRLAQEYLPAGEAEYIHSLIERLQTKMIKDNSIGIMRRDAHPKMHRIVKAEFVVEFRVRHRYNHLPRMEPRSWDIPD